MNQLAIPLRVGIKRLSKIPWAFDCLRWILEGGYRRHRELLARHFPTETCRVLDCGCGTGIHATFFPPSSYLGVDISPDYIVRARTCFPEHRFRVMDATQLDFADSSFDALIISGVIHHLDGITAKRVLDEVSRVLSPQGKLLLWEDVPTCNPLNLVGRIVHSLDVGEYIRTCDEYAQLLSKRFYIEAIETIRSGFMDYAAFRCTKEIATSSVAAYRAPSQCLESSLIS